MPEIINELETPPEPNTPDDTSLSAVPSTTIDEAAFERLLRHLRDRQRRILAD